MFPKLAEPTSGLDSTSSKEVCACLKEIAENNGLTVVTVVHQPRYEIFKVRRCCTNLKLCPLLFFGNLTFAFRFHNWPPSKCVTSFKRLVLFFSQCQPNTICSHLLVDRTRKLIVNFFLRMASCCSQMFHSVLLLGKGGRTVYLGM